MAPNAATASDEQNRRSYQSDKDYNLVGDWADEIHRQIGPHMDNLDAVREYYQRHKFDNFRRYDGPPEGVTLHQGAYNSRKEPLGNDISGLFENLRRTITVASVPGAVPKIGGDSIELGIDVSAKASPDLAGEIAAIVVIGGVTVDIVSAEIGLLGDEDSPFCAGGKQKPGPLPVGIGTYACIGADITNSGANIGFEISVDVPATDYCPGPFNCQVNPSVDGNCGIQLSGDGIELGCSF